MAKKRMDEATKKRVQAGQLLQKGKTPAEIAVIGVAYSAEYRLSTCKVAVGTGAGVCGMGNGGLARRV